MKAAWFERFGSANDVIRMGEIDRPSVGHGEVLVRLYASGTNPSDTKKRAGAFPDLLAGGMIIPNSDGAGVIEAVGPGVMHSRIGERVWVYQAQYGRRFGTAAEYVAIDGKRAAPLPGNVDFSVGACMGIPAMTAHRCVHADGPVQGQLVLVTGGAGRVGYYAIQWAKLAGAMVIATASNDATRNDCLAAGADYVISHREPEWHKALLAVTDGRKVDRVIDVDFGANLSSVLEVIRIGGTVATYSSSAAEPALPFRKMMFMDMTLRMVIVYAMPESAKEHAINDIGDALAHGLLTHRIAQRYPLEHFAESNNAIEKGGLNGCVVVEIN
ncbi:NADPH:quinone reductase [Sapientia aquatica]|uniref:NADPH:quinone reductase n=1 Tax=Sapientia aquatica TaxID=1549640 RepID=A0A4R5VPV7_9BURK|nr:NADPH:quinone reductase [Sapientia aquatica]TDK60454.1 NADPH:quinone reductase [Sapientia aquatica]